MLILFYNSFFVKQLVVNIKEDKYQFILELMKNFDFVQVEEQSESTKEETLASLDQSFNELKQYKDGKLEAIPIKDILDEL